MKEKTIKYIRNGIASGIIAIAFIWLCVINTGIASWYANGIYQQQYQSLEMLRNTAIAIFWGLVALVIKE